MADFARDEADAPPFEVDDHDSAFGEGSTSETTSVASSLLKGHMENGRRYSTLREGYWGPSDDQQFGVLDSLHTVYLLMRSDQENLLFAAPIQDPKRILDIGTGTGEWAIDVADKYPDASVHGVDLFPSPNTWVPPNCFLEVEDVAKEWTWKQKFDFIHVRFMVGSFSDDEWNDLYRKVYEHLEPGGWIEQCEFGVSALSDDGTLDPDGYITKWGPIFIECANRAGRSLETIDFCRPAIERAGFENIKEQHFKVPIGAWAKDKRLKEAGWINYQAWLEGLEGGGLLLLTHFGSPEPWSKEEALVWISKVRTEFQKSGQHIYQFARRVWAQKPFAEDAAAKS